MASYPPPNPYTQPPYGSPYGQTPRDQRRMARDQAKLQQAAFKRQRELYRQQSRSLRRTSIVGPLLVLGFGTVALLVSLGRLPMPTVATWFSHWWPLVIVASGLVLVGEWAFDQRSAADGTPALGRRSLGGGTVFLLILLIIAGLTSQTIHTQQMNGNGIFSQGFFGNSRGWNEIFEDKYDREQQIDQAFAPGTSLSVTNPRGAITILGRSADDKIHINVTKQIYSQSQQDADSRADSFTPHLDLSGGALHISMPSLEGASADLNISVPETAQTTVSADHGDVNISNLKAPVNVTANRGDVALDQVIGTVVAHLNSSHTSFTAHHIQGTLDVEGKSDDLSVTDVTGSVALIGEFYGDTHLEHLTGGVNFHSNRTQLTLARLDGELDLSPESDLTGSQIAGPIELHTRNRNVNLTQVAGNVVIANSNGSVNVSNTLPLGNVSIDNRNGSVSLTLPANSGATFHAQTREGELQNEFGLAVTKDGSHQQLTGAIGDGTAQISIDTTHDDVTIHKAAATQLLTPAPPAASASAKSEGKTGKPHKSATP